MPLPSSDTLEIYDQIDVVNYVASGRKVLLSTAAIDSVTAFTCHPITHVGPLHERDTVRVRKDLQDYCVSEREVALPLRKLRYARAGEDDVDDAQRKGRERFLGLAQHEKKQGDGMGKEKAFRDKGDRQQGPDRRAVARDGQPCHERPETKRGTLVQSKINGQSWRKSCERNVLSERDRPRYTVDTQGRRKFRNYSILDFASSSAHDVEAIPGPRSPQKTLSRGREKKKRDHEDLEEELDVPSQDDLAHAYVETSKARGQPLEEKGSHRLSVATGQDANEEGAQESEESMQDYNASIWQMKKRDRHHERGRASCERVEQGKKRNDVRHGGDNVRAIAYGSILHSLLHSLPPPLFIYLYIYIYIYMRNIYIYIPVLFPPLSLSPSLFFFLVKSTFLAFASYFLVLFSFLIFPSPSLLISFLFVCRAMDQIFLPLLFSFSL